jgi:hypothetical protein
MIVGPMRQRKADQATGNQARREVMMSTTRRLILRRYRTQTIEFGPRSLEAIYRGEMTNYSMRGMRFASPVAMPQGERIWIRSASGQKPLDSDLPGAKINAVVCWCRAEPKADAPVFSIGVNF